MKSIFAVALATLDDWKRRHLSNEQIEQLLAQNERDSASVATPISSKFWAQRDRLHSEYNHVYSCLRLPVPVIDEDLELPAPDPHKPDPLQESALAEKQMRWGALKLIEYAAGSTQKSGAFPLNSTKRQLEKLYKLCFARDILAWDMTIHTAPSDSPGKRKDFSRTFAKAKDAACVKDIFNTILFVAHGYGEEPKLITQNENPQKLHAPEGITAEKLLDVLRVEYDWNRRKETARKNER